MEAVFELEYPHVAELMQQAYGNKVRNDGTPYMHHPQWVGDTAAQVLYDLQASFPGYIDDDMVQAVRIDGYMHDAREIDPTITQEAIELAAQVNTHAKQIGHTSMLLTHDKHESPFLDYTLHKIPQSAVAVLIKLCDIAHNLFVAPKPQPNKATYIHHKEEYLQSMEYYLQIADDYTYSAPWLKQAVKKVLQTTSNQRSLKNEDHLNKWLDKQLA